MCHVESRLIAFALESMWMHVEQYSFYRRNSTYSTLQDGTDIFNKGGKHRCMSKCIVKSMCVYMG